MSVRVRFAPSPTGYVHIGSLRTALYNYLYAKKNKGKYIIRVEDTDQTRLVEDAIEKMIESMAWAGIVNDEGPIIENDKIVQNGGNGPYIQSERLNIYNEYIEKLINSGDAYYCFCTKDRLDKLREYQKIKGLTSKYDGHCRDIDIKESKKRVDNGEEYVVRLKLPHDRDISFDDIVRGKVTFNTNDLDDQVLMKTDGYPTYHLAVVVDDHLMDITHIIRGEEWLSSTPKHVLLYEAFGWEMPKYVHLPNILNSEKKKLSKRHGDVAVEDFRRKGYLPEALINYIALLGWSPKDEREFLSMEELIEQFSLDRVSKSGGVFDIDKLNWMNNHYIKEADNNMLTNMAMPYLLENKILDDTEIETKYEWIKSIVALVKEKLDYMSQITDYVKEFMVENIVLSDDVSDIMNADSVKNLLIEFKKKILNLENLENEYIKGAIKELQMELGIKGKDLFMPIRIGITGETHGSDLIETIKILGKDKIEKRLNSVIDKL